MEGLLRHSEVNYQLFQWNTEHDKSENRSKSEEEYRRTCRRFEGYVLAYLRQLGEQPYVELCAVFDPRENVGLHSILQEMNKGKSIEIVNGSVSITDSGLKQLEHED